MRAPLHLPLARGGLLVDLGNTRLKAAWASPEGPTEVSTSTYSSLQPAFWQQWPRPAWVACTSTLAASHPMHKQLEGLAPTFWRMHTRAQGPIEMAYKTPDTLGPDRLAAAYGARSWAPAGATLVIDLGTAITYEYLTAEHTYLGGAISPGWAMRYQALGHFTANLPSLTTTEEPDMLGQNTDGAIHSGVWFGLLGELQSVIKSYRALAGPSLSVFITGGDAPTFENHLESAIFADPQLVLRGLQALAHYNLPS